MLIIIACPGSDPVDAALCFYKALKVYPQPRELISIYDKTVPKVSCQTTTSSFVPDSDQQTAHPRHPCRDDCRRQQHIRHRARRIDNFACFQNPKSPISNYNNSLPPCVSMHRKKTTALIWLFSRPVLYHHTQSCIYIYLDVSRATDVGRHEPTCHIWHSDLLFILIGIDDCYLSFLYLPFPFCSRSALCRFLSSFHVSGQTPGSNPLRRTPCCDNHVCKRP